MVDVPADTPVITPVVLPVVATAVLLLLQMPPDDELLNVVVTPEHTVTVPVMPEGFVFAASVLVATLHPLPRSYVIVVVPVVTPDTMPVVLPIVATAVLLLLHIPPALGSLKVAGLPTHVVAAPVIAPGVWLTATVVLAGV